MVLIINTVRTDVSGPAGNTEHLSWRKMQGPEETDTGLVGLMGYDRKKRSSVERRNEAAQGYPQPQGWRKSLQSVKDVRVLKSFLNLLWFFLLCLDSQRL